MENKILTRREAAQTLKVSLPSLDLLLRRDPRDNPLAYIRAGRRVLIPKQAIDDWLASEVQRRDRQY